MPRVFPEMSARAVLTMERIRGVPVLDILAALETNDASKLGGWAAEGIPPERVAHLLLGSVAERVVRTAECPVLTVRGTSAALATLSAA